MPERLIGFVIQTITSPYFWIGVIVAGFIAWLVSLSHGR